MSDKTKHIVGFSGGIDSQACARWVLNRFPKEDVILINSNAGGNEHPLTDEFVDWYSDNIHPVVKVTAVISDIWKTPGFAETKGLNGDAPLTFGELIGIKGRPPSRTALFCTETLKLRPQKRWMDQSFGPGGAYEGCDFARYTGVRRDESQGRKDYPYQQWDNYYDCDLFAPLIDWPKQWCFDYVKAHGENINQLYLLRFSRVGCAPCVNSSKAEIANWATRSPEMIAKVREWEKSTGISFFLPPRGELKTPGDGKFYFIDEVVEWAKTSRGGRQQPFPIFHEREACESKYGLCE